MDDVKWMIARELPHLRRFAVALTRDRPAADDLVQDCLERALRKRHLWRRRGTVRSWLFRVLYRLYIDRARAAGAKEARTDSIEDMSLSLHQSANQEQRLYCHGIVAAMDRLPPEQRAAILLVALEDLSYDQAAEVLDIPIGTLRSRLSRGREALRRHTQGHDAGHRLRRVK